jgi:hypothetical protein
MYESPSPLHRITCNPIPVGVKCTLGPIDGRGRYRITIANNIATPPRLDVAGSVQLIPLNETDRAPKRGGHGIELVSGALLVGTALSLVFLSVSYVKRLQSADAEP